MFYTLIFFLSSGFLFSSQAYSALPIIKHPSDDNLTAAFASFRKGQVRSVSYDLKFTFKKETDTYQGKAILNIELARVDAPLSIDFKWKKINALIVNEVPLTKYHSGQGHFEIPAKLLAAHMAIEVDYTNEFSQTGDGVSKTKDPEDKLEYIATDFEPYMAHALFPCFDQPDLKATYKVSITTPSDWKAISNEMIDQRSESETTTTNYFKKTKPFSTYLFFLAVGPYQEWSDQEGNIPLFLYARKSLAKYVDVERIFEVTRKGLRFYTGYFETPYPFSKYGQIFIPEFTWGGMENPGAIALQETYIFREAVTKSRMDDRDNLILHEMSHMWFGDLVTMKWWNDLWLNESFASYIAALAMDRAMKAKSAWIDFAGSKAWAYWQDQLITTHPIETDVLDTRSARGNFDGITYAKGAASLKQLNFFVGEENFRQGLISYFANFSYKNSERQDFINHISKAANTALDPWVKKWLKTAGPSKVSVDWGCHENKITRFSIVQNPSSSGTLSPHRARIGFFNRANGIFQLTKTLDASYADNRTEITPAVGMACPDFVYANLDDHDYALFSLDSTSLIVVKEALGQSFEDPLLRVMLWITLGQMVRTQELSPHDYFETAFKALEQENDEILLGNVLGPHSTLNSQYKNYLTPKQRSVLAPRFENIIWKRLEASKSNSSSQLLFFDFFVSIAQTPESLARLLDLVNGKNKLKGLEIGHDRRWAIITSLAQHGDVHAESLVLKEEKLDPSTVGQRSAYAARIAMPTLANKLKYWNDFQTPSKLGHNTLQEGTAAFHHENFPDLSQEFIKPFFEKVSKLNWKDSDMLVSIYFDHLFPSTLCSRDLLKKSVASLKASKGLTSLAKRAWLEANDELSRCVKIRKPDR